MKKNWYKILYDVTVTSSVPQNVSMMEKGPPEQKKWIHPNSWLAMGFKLTSSQIYYSEYL